MIDLDRFEQNKPLVTTALNNINRQLSHLIGAPVALILQPTIDEALLTRMLHLEEQIFRIEDNIYSKEDILECLAEEDSLLLLLTIDNKVEGYVFGYDEDISKPTVKGTEYFLDSAVVSLAYEQKGIGSMVSGVVLLMLYLLNYREVGLLTEERDKTGRELVRFYEKMGFKLVEKTEQAGCAMRITLNEQIFNEICNRLGITDIITK